MLDEYYGQCCAPRTPVVASFLLLHRLEIFGVRYTDMGHSIAVTLFAWSSCSALEKLGHVNKLDSIEICAAVHR